MKIVSIIVISNTLLLGQVEPNFNLTPENVTLEAQKIQTGGETLDFVRSVFQSQRIELILICFKTPQTEGAFSMILEKEPDSDFKNQIILKILQEPWRYDELPGKPLPQGSRPAPVLEYICVETLKRYLPQENLDFDKTTFHRINSFAERQKLATLLEKALTQEPPTTPKDTVQTPPLRTDDKIKDSNSVSKIALPKSTSALTPASSTLLNENSKNNTKWWVMAVMGILLVLTIWGTTRGSRSSASERK